MESIHCGSIVVVNSEGKVIYSFGNPNFFTFLRSSAKPFQILPLIESGAAKEFGFTHQELAIISGSHNGEPKHINLVKRILKKIGLSDRYLRCGTHPPLYYTNRGILPRRGEKFSVLQHNCSGKHSGMLAACAYNGWDPKEYNNPGHPLQRSMLQAISEVCQYPAKKIKIGIDGCSAPNFALPLKNMALGFAKLVSARENSSPLSQVLQAMQKYPEMVSGKGRLDFALSQVAGGKIIAKAGAEALECFGIVGPDLGGAVRIYDGNNRGGGCVVIEVLKQMGILKQADLVKMSKFAHPIITNNSGETVGFIKPVFKLKRMSK